MLCVDTCVDILSSHPYFGLFEIDFCLRTGACIPATS